MGEFTKGPWSADLSGEGIKIRDPAGASLAMVMFVHLKGRRAQDDVLANAHLIAAAPDLFEALRGAIGALEFSRDYHKDLGNEEQAFAQDRLDAALAALRKAQGDSQ